MKLLLNITIILSVLSMQYATATDIDCLFHEEDSPVSQEHESGSDHEHETQSDHEHKTQSDHEHIKATSHIDASDDHHSEDSSHYHASDDQCCSVTVFFIKSVPIELQYSYVGLLCLTDTIFIPVELMKYAPLIRPPIAS